MSMIIHDENVNGYKTGIGFGAVTAPHCFRSQPSDLRLTHEIENCV